jgi:predicted phosphodiesterase
MRIAIVSDIHGNLTAFHAVLDDLKLTAPDLILHGGDLAHSGSSPAQVIDLIQSLGWPGVLGNTDEMLYRPETLTAAAGRSPQLAPMWAIIQEQAAFTREILGADRLAWLRTLPLTYTAPPAALTHAPPTDLWKTLLPTTPDAELDTTFRPLAQPIAVYAHIHRPYIRELPPINGQTLTVANTGSTSLPHDGDPRASCLLINHGLPQTRRVPYDIDHETQLLLDSGLPQAPWVAGMLRTATFEMP